MSKRFVSERNIEFLLYEVFDAELLTQYPYFGTYNRQLFNMVLQAAIELAEHLLWPNFQEMDRNQPELIGDLVKVQPCVRAMMKEYGQGGWIGATVREEFGGQQLPNLIGDSCYFIFAAANYSASAYALLSAGAAHLIELYGDQNLIGRYLPKILSGQWQGTMAMTEPDAGSSLSDIATTAEPTDKGYYKIQGQKIFISAGDHDAVENTVHLMLGRIKGAPPGVKGLSLFVVPQKRIDDDGNLVSNDVITSGIFHKLGYRGCPLTQLSIGDKDDCQGYLIGKPHKGLGYMFQMMNEERIWVGIGATGGATAAYYAALDYSQKRSQGRKPSEKDPSKPQIPIIKHADVKRMLLFQRAVVEGSLSLLLQCSQYMDFQTVRSGSKKEKYSFLLDLLTPIAKTYPSEVGILAISQGLQCFGGSGFCDDYPLELYYRDARIHPIHEGTTGIHAIDLLGRKVIIENGRAFEFYLEEVQAALEEAKKILRLGSYAQQLSEALEKLKRVTSHLVENVRKKGQDHFLADATLYLELFGIISIAWQWLLQAVAVNKALEKDLSERENSFYHAKFCTFRYFFAYELPKIEPLITRLMNNDGLTVEMKEVFFLLERNRKKTRTNRG
jgi:butyryl-CoA dehydrogenase